MSEKYYTFNVDLQNELDSVNYAQLFSDVVKKTIEESIARQDEQVFKALSEHYGVKYDIDKEGAMKYRELLENNMECIHEYRKEDYNIDDNGARYVVKNAYVIEHRMFGEPLYKVTDL